MNIGVDLGGTRLHIALISNNKIVKEIRTTHKRKDRKYLLRELVKNIESLFNKKVKGIAIGVAGIVKDGKVIDAPNIPSLDNVDLKKIIQKKFRTRVLVENDVNCFAVKQHSVHKVKNLVAITLGTGVGSGIIANNRLYRGQGSAAEIGHMVITDNGEKEFSGRAGTFEAYCSGTAIEKRFFKLTGKKLKTSEIAGLKNKKSKKIIQETGYYLGVALANVVNILNPEIIVIGGSVTNIKELLPIAEKEMKKRILKGVKVRLIRSTARGSTVLGAVKLLG